MRYVMLVLFYFSLVRAFANGQSSDVSTKTVEEWIKIEKGVHNLTKHLIKQIFPFLFRGSSLVLSEKCQIHLLKIAFGLYKYDEWALILLDSNGRSISKVIRGANSEYGSFDQCIKLAVPEKSKKIIFRGKYCLIKITPPLPQKQRFLTIDKPLKEFINFSSDETIIRYLAKYAQIYYFGHRYLGICLPSTCSNKDIENILSLLCSSLGLNAEITHCEVQNELTVTKEQIVVSCVIAFLCLIVISGTLLDVYYHYNVKNFETKEEIYHRYQVCELLLKFSIKGSIVSLLNTNLSSHSLPPVYGIRFLTMIWIIFKWPYQNILFRNFRPVLQIVEFRKNVMLQPFLNYNLAVDTLFFISGFLSTYIILRIVYQSKKTSCLLLFILYRIYRILPSVMLVIGMVMFLPRIGSGPLWHQTIDPIVNNCKKNWWTNVLLVNNYVEADKMCLEQTWFLAADFQLYLMTLMIIFILIWNPLFGHLFNFLFCIGSMIVTGYITWLKDLPPAMLFVHPDPEQRKEFLINLQYLPYPHAGSCCVGIAAGYVLIKHPNLTIKWWIQIVGWTLCVLSNIIMLYGEYKWNQNYDLGPTVIILYASIHRTIWSLGVSWLTVACCTGHGGVINEFLSWKAFKPLSRLTFLTYIFYSLDAYITAGYAREDYQPNHLMIISYSFPCIIISYGVAFIAGVLWEAPFIAIVRWRFPKKSA